MNSFIFGLKFERIKISFSKCRIEGIGLSTTPRSSKIYLSITSSSSSGDFLIF